MALFNFPPFDASGSTGFLDPQLAYDAQASLGQANPPAAAAASPSILSQLGGSGQAWGPALMALGAGIAANAGQGWGPGIGKGLAAATAVGQTQRNEAIKQQQLQAQLQHQQIMENLGLLNARTSAYNAETNAGLRTDAENRRAQEEITKQSKLAGPIGLISSGAQNWPTLKETLLSDRWAGPTGPEGTAMQAMLDGAAELSGVKPEQLYQTMLPNAWDGPEKRAAKLNTFERYMGNLRGSVERGNPGISDSLWASDAFTSKPKMIPSAPVAPVQTGAPQQAGAVQGLSQGPLPFEKDRTKRQPDQVYNFPNGAQAIWRVFPGGQSGWEQIQ